MADISDGESEGSGIFMAGIIRAKDCEMVDEAAYAAAPVVSAFSTRWLAVR
jgi:hypothetical protein